ncbi:MAG TPA: right-handed parallel beta-helix repeat-containing protein [Acidimicrobiia bacterium]
MFGAAALAAGGGVALGATPASAATVIVNSKAQLQAAWGNAATSDITLAADIGTCGTMSRSSTTAVAVHGNGHALYGTCPGELLRQTGVGAVQLFDMTLRDAMFRSDAEGADGAAIDAPRAPVRIDHDLVANNNSFERGAVNGKSVVAVSSRFVDNGKLADNYGLGGYGAIVGGNVTVQGSTFTGNEAYGIGAGVNATGNVTITGSTFTGGGANDGAGAVWAANATISDSTFSNIYEGGCVNPGCAVSVGGTVRIAHSTFTNDGADAGDGGAVGGATVAVTDSTFSDNNSGDGPGGAIHGGDVSVTRSRFQGNQAVGSGGAIEADHSLLVVASTFDANATEGTGGAISGGSGASLAVVNSTITGNFTDGREGTAIFTAGPLRLQFDTIADNNGGERAPNAPAQIYGTVAATLMPVRGTVVVGGAPGPDCVITTTSGGSNYDDDGTCGFTGSGDVSHGPNPQLGALADNGGPTRTMLPAASSPLVNAVVGTCLALDQRGVARPRGPACDIGSVER